MDLTNINSVSDLLAANQQQPEVTEHNDETLYELALEHLDATEATKLAIALVNQLAIYHQNTRNNLVESGECERVGMWAFDEAQLACALHCLQSVTLD